MVTRIVLLFALGAYAASCRPPDGCVPRATRCLANHSQICDADRYWRELSAERGVVRVPVRRRGDRGRPPYRSHLYARARRRRRGIPMSPEIRPDAVVAFWQHMRERFGTTTVARL
jgi:hypothetical protein